MCKYLNIDFSPRQDVNVAAAKRIREVFGKKLELKNQFNREATKWDLQSGPFNSNKTFYY